MFETRTPQTIFHTKYVGRGMLMTYLCTRFHRQLKKFSYLTINTCSLHPIFILH